VLKFTLWRVRMTIVDIEMQSVGLDVVPNNVNVFIVAMEI